MPIEPPWLMTAVSWLGATALGLLLLAAALRWWRQRLPAADLRSIRARIAEAAPGSAPVAAPPALRQVQPRDRSSLGQRTRLASSFVGRDPGAEPV